ncbi:MAG: STN domain-containing protein [Bdellovibrionia bacterium]
MIVRLIILVGVLLVGIYTFVPMNINAQSLPGHKVTVQQQKIGVRDALTSLLDETEFKYKLSNNVTNDKQITIDFTEMSWDEVFKYVLSEGGLSYRITAKKMILVSP